MSVKSMYRIGFSYLQKSGKENNLDLDSKKFQRKANYSRNCVLILMILNLHEFQKMKRITDKNLLVKLYLAKDGQRHLKTGTAVQEHFYLCIMNG